MQTIHNVTFFSHNSEVVFHFPPPNNERCVAGMPAPYRQGRPASLTALRSPAILRVRAANQRRQ